MAMFAVTTARGASWDRRRGIREQEGWGEHAAFADALVDKGVIVLGGPISSDDEEDVALIAVRAGDEREVRSIFDGDPWAANGVLRVKQVRAWTLWLDSRAQAEKT